MDKVTIKPSYYEISNQKLHFLGDMDDCIRPTSVPKRYIGFPRSGHTVNVTVAAALYLTVVLYNCVLVHIIKEVLNSVMSRLPALVGHPADNY